MAQSTLIFEASKNDVGDYECHSVSEEKHAEHQANQHQQGFVDLDSGDLNSGGFNSGDLDQPYYIDPGVVHSMPPTWAVQANELFEQGLRSNSQGGYTEYLTQMREQFEQMRQTLNEQMNQHNQNEG